MHVVDPLRQLRAMTPALRAAHPLRDLRVFMKALRPADPLGELGASLKALHAADPLRELGASIKALQASDPLREPGASIKALQASDPLRELGASLKAMQLAGPLRELHGMARAIRFAEPIRGLRATMNAVLRLAHPMPEVRAAMKAGQLGGPAEIGGALHAYGAEISHRLATVNRAILHIAEPADDAGDRSDSDLTGGVPVEQDVVRAMQTLTLKLDELCSSGATFEDAMQAVADELRASRRSDTKAVLLQLVWPLVLVLIAAVLNPLMEAAMADKSKKADAVQIVREIVREVPAPISCRIGVVVVRRVVGRERPRSRSAEVAALPAGTAVVVEDKVGKWTLVTWQDAASGITRSAWVISRAVEKFVCGPHGR